MHKRIAPGLAVVAAGLVGLVSGPTPAAGQDKGKAPPAKAAGPKFLYGHDLKVRPGGDKDWDKARKISLEVYQDEFAVSAGDQKKTVAVQVAVTDDGVVAAAAAVALGDRKEWEYKGGMALSARKAAEREFTQKTQKFGVELFRDLRANRLVYGCESGAIAFAPVPGNLADDKGPKFQHGFAVRVRAPDQDTFENAKGFGVEAYKDENTGGLVYITDAGAISAGPAAAAPSADKTKVADPKPSHGLILRVRKADEADFTTKTQRLGVEVFEDPSAANNLVYVSESGSVAVAPAAKFRDGKGVLWRGAMKVSARKPGEKEFDKARKFGVEVFEDVKTGNLLFVTETGSIAVVVP